MHNVFYCKLTNDNDYQFINCNQLEFIVKETSDLSLLVISHLSDMHINLYVQNIYIYIS